MLTIDPRCAGFPVSQESGPKDYALFPQSSLWNTFGFLVITLNAVIWTANVFFVMFVFWMNKYLSESLIGLKGYVDVVIQKSPFQLIRSTLNI